MLARTLTPVSTNAVPWNPDQTLPATINPDLGAQLHALFDAPDPSVVPSGVLHWFGDPELPDGTELVPVLSQASWSTYYTRLQTAAIAPGVLPALESITTLSNQYRADGPVPIAIANVALSVVTPEFSQQVLAAALAGTGLDPAPNGLAEVIRPAHAFMATPMLHGQYGMAAPAVRSRAVTFVMDERFYVTNPGAPLPDAMELDLGDGKPARMVNFGDRVTALYPTGDSATIRLRARYGNTELESRATIAISDKATAPIPDDTWSLFGLPSGNTGTAYVWRAKGHADVVNPVIVCEGFPGGYPYDYVYDCLAATGTVDAMLSRGYDLVVVSFANGTDQMQHNADVVIAAITQALTRVRKTNAATEPLVVGGVSMGAIIARYALALMETRRQDHGTRLYFSVDGPHSGAYTSVADQWLMQYLAPASSMAAGLHALINTPANQQFMLDWVSGNAIVPSPLRAFFLRDLEGVGSWPQRPKRVAIASGRGDGQRSVAAHDQMLEWGGGPFASARLYSLPEGPKGAIVAEAYCFRAAGSAPATLTASSQWSWEGAPGGQNMYNAMAAAVAQGIGIGALNDDVPVSECVPTVSALGMDLTTADPFAPVPAPGSDTVPFHDFICGTENSPHIAITREASAFLLKQLGMPAVVAAKVVSPSTPPKFDPGSFNPHDPDFIKNPYPTYKLFREQRPVAFVQPYNTYWVFRHEDVMRVLHDSEHFEALTFAKNQADPPAPPPPSLFEVNANLPEGLFNLDPPRHGPVRSMMDGYLANLLGRVPGIASVLARQFLVNAKQNGGRIELYTSYALPLPAMTLFSVLGLPQQDWTGLMGWVSLLQGGHDITAPTSARALAGSINMALSNYFQGMLKGQTDSRCPVHAAPGMLFDQMAKDGLGPMPKMSGEEIQSTCVNLAVAGYLSTTFLIATGLLNLLGGTPLPGEDWKPPVTPPIDLLRKNPQLLHGAINEMLRYDAPFQLIDRVVVNRSTTLGGQKLKIGDSIQLVFGSANRDESVYQDPDTFDITRQGPPNLGFGWGIHRCYGAPLVEQVAPVAFQMLLQELPVITLAGTPQWQTDPYIRSVSNLPLAIG